MLKTNMLSIQNVRLQQRCHSFLVLSLKPRHSQDHQIFSSYCRGVAIRRNGELNIQNMLLEVPFAIMPIGSKEINETRLLADRWKN